MDLATIEAIIAGVKEVGPAFDRLIALIKSGAPKADLEAELAVIHTVVEQFKEVIGTYQEPPAPPATPAA